MAKTNWQDPKTGEIISPHISGLQEAVGKLEESIGMESKFEEDISMSEVFISNDDRCRIYQAPEGKRNWLSSPTPIVKKNGDIITDDFSIDYGGGAIIFTTPLSSSDNLTADVAYTQGVADKILDLIASVGELENLDTTEKTNLVLSLNEVYHDLKSHKSSTMPHIMTDHRTGKVYRFGRQVSSDGVPQIISEEVSDQ